MRGTQPPRGRRRKPSPPVNTKPPSPITPCSSVDPNVAARQYGSTSSSGGHQYSQEPGQEYDIRAQQGVPGGTYRPPNPWFTGMDHPRRMSQRSGRVQQGFGVPDESSESEAPNQQATAAELLRAKIEQGLASSSASPGVESVREDAMTGADPTAGMDTLMDAYSGIPGLPYDMARQDPPDADPWHDSNPMTQELSALAWQQAIDAHSASMQGQDPSLAAQAAYEQAVANVLSHDNSTPQPDFETVLRRISDVAEQQAIALYGDTPTPQQREQTLDDLVRRLLPGHQDPTDIDMPLLDPHAMQQQPDDQRMQDMADLFDMMRPMM